MGLGISSTIVTDGLVFAYDAQNIKSYKGPPIQNLALGLSVNAYTSTGISITGGTEEVDIPGLGPVTAAFANIQNNYTSFTPNSADCCPSPFSYGNGRTVLPSTLYTYGIVYKVDSGYTNPNYMYRYEYTASNGAYVGEGGIHSDANRISLGNGWWWAWGTFTTQPTTNWLGYTAAFYYRYSNNVDKMSVAKVFIAQGNWTGLHPKYWPNVATTRSNNQTIFDMVGGNIVTVNGTPTYNTNSITFPNSNSVFLDIGTPSSFRLGVSNFTLSVWIKQLDNGNNVILEARDDNLLGYLWVLNYTTAGQITLFLNHNSSQQVYYSNLATLPFGSVQNITTVVNRVSGTIRHYLNGTLWDTVTGVHSNSISGTTGDIYRLGYDKGGSTQNYELYSYMHYNRALTDAEVRQNFNATRGRYGI